MDCVKDGAAAPTPRALSGDPSTPGKPRVIYKNKTFDPDNGNKVDAKTTIIMQQDVSGPAEPKSRCDLWLASPVARLRPN